jgi:clan AA aspartic protease
MSQNTPLQSLSIIDPLHPTLELQISDGASKRTSKVPALIDTGFDGYLSLPASLAKELELEIIGETEVEVATGHNFVVQICICRFFVVDLDLSEIEVEAIISDEGEILIGTKYLDLNLKTFTIDFANHKMLFDTK